LNILKVLKVWSRLFRFSLY